MVNSMLTRSDNQKAFRNEDGTTAGGTGGSFDVDL